MKKFREMQYEKKIGTVLKLKCIEMSTNLQVKRGYLEIYLGLSGSGKNSKEEKAIFISGA